mmetsp:Transcript_23192/g.34018  ORF Transcript_23192/g.34018 Transcript_23192/m.34018 type:complete len:491 (-) Transcript_23192:227-1699(-)
MTLIDHNTSTNSVSGNQLKRTLGFYDGLCVIVSVIIGSGIFASPGAALDRSGSPASAIIVWAISGVLSIAAALCYAELGAMLPTTGGDFVYLRRAYGKTAAFSFVWFNFWVAQPGSQAIIATVFGNYIVTLFTGLDQTTSNSTPSKAAAVLIIAVLVGVNCGGVRESSMLNKTLTAAKVVMLLCVIAAGVVYGCSHGSTARNNLSPSTSFDDTDASGFGPAMNACLWAYSGWQSLNFLAEEVIDFERRLSRIIIFGMAIVTSLYVMANIAFLSVLDSESMTDSDAIAIDFGKMISGSAFGGFFALGVALSTAGTLHGSILVGSRALFAAARAGQLHSALAELNSFGSPWVALLIQGIWSIVLVLLPGSDFSSLIDYTGPATWLYYAFTGSTIFYFRLYEKDLHRPYSLPWFPFPPVLLIVLSAFVVISSLIREPLYCGLAFVFVATSVPVWWLLSRYDVKGLTADKIEAPITCEHEAPVANALRPPDVEL